jgi:hypothetical protein
MSMDNAYAVRPDALTPDDCPEMFRDKTFIILFIEETEVWVVKVIEHSSPMTLGFEA